MKKLIFMYYFIFFHFLLHSFSLAQNANNGSSYTTTPYRMANGQNTLDLGLLSIGQSFDNDFNYGDLNHTFEISIPKNMTGYLMVEVRQSPNNFSNEILFLAKFNGAFSRYDFSSFTTDADIYDFIGYSLQKDYHYLIMEGTLLQKYSNKDTNANQSWYFSIYEPTFSSQFSYNIKITQYDTRPCPNSCSSFGNGYCINGYCNCPDGFIDEDCSSTGTLISSSRTQGQILYPNDLVYFYYNIPAKYNDTLSLRVQKPMNTNLKIYLSFSNFTIISLPTTEFYLGKPLDLTSSESVFYLMIDKWSYRNDFYYGSRQMYFGVVNLDSITSTVYMSISPSSLLSSNDVKAQDESNSNNLYLIVIASVISIILFLLLICLCRCIIRNYKIYCFSKRNPRNFANQGINGGINNDIIHQAQARIKKKKDKTLTTDLITKFLPEVLFSTYSKTIMKKEVEASCAVCLEEFKSSDICRESICKHIFHKECLDTWMVKHENCPYCRTVMDLPSLEEYKQKENLKGDPNLDDQMRLIDIDEAEMDKNRVSGEGHAGNLVPLKIQIQHQDKRASGLNILERNN